MFNFNTTKPFVEIGMFGFHLLLATASARFFVPALHRSSERFTGAAAPTRVTPHAAPVIVAHSMEEDRMLTPAYYLGLFAGVAALGLGATSARKAFRRQGLTHGQVLASTVRSIRFAWADLRAAGRLRRAPARVLQEKFPFRAGAAPRTPGPQMHGDHPAEGVRAKEYKMDAEVGEVAEVPFELRLSLGNVISFSGAVLFVFCIGKFLLNNGESDVVSTFGFVYAIPALVGGLALKYAELPPVPLRTSPEAQEKRELLGTTIQKQILSDATRFTYGDAHMEGPLRALKLAPRGMAVPQLVSLAEAVTPEGHYSLTMRFYAPNTPYSVWKERGARYARFFAPDIRAVLKKFNKKKRLVELSLVTFKKGESDEPLELLEDGSYRSMTTSSWSSGWQDDSLPAWDMTEA
jgi:hypothetical protein